MYAEIRMVKDGKVIRSGGMIDQLIKASRDLLRRGLRPRVIYL